MNITEVSKYICLILRHKPEVIGITLDEHGYANVSELIAGVSKKYPISLEILEKIVETDDKKRYSFNSDKSKLRANQGHSVKVDVELTKAAPPEILYHGTGEKYVSSIDAQGLIPKSRLYVHLSPDYDTAIKAGARHGKAGVYKINSAEMEKDGFDFYLSVNGVWLTKFVPVEYMEKTSNVD